MTARRFIDPSHYRATFNPRVSPMRTQADALIGSIESHPAWPCYRPATQTRRTDGDHYRAFAGPYQPGERWMMENAIADLRRARRHFRVVRETFGRPDLLSIFVR